ncbi:DNA integrity scanning protein DisA nucleotide-binding domain protein [Desulfobulbus rhabdoformis]|uniref:DNA integrity scanning protein DisA nucleotide-binding domain protein n=1 Tax=Desulfobulbus rhabdoformis TaxID=34032 RepID=UPI001F05446D|nr:DNA integrity scanning protein DisA nucleotide-binding domain protein [Desulfobulbus rhabdoformis]
MSIRCNAPLPSELSIVDRRQYSFIRRCVSDIIFGLTDGLTHFSGSSRAAVIFALHPKGPMLICDPQNLLRGHEPIFKSLYVDNETWREHGKISADRKQFADIKPVKDPGLAGLLSNGGYSGAVFFQQWFTEHHPDLCSVGPTQCWLEHAAWRFSHDMANDNELYTGISGYFLREYSTHAVRDYIIDQMNMNLGWDSPVRVYPVLDAVLMISETREEGSWPEGRLLVVDPCMLDQLDFMVKFQEGARPQLINYKHVRKLLLTVEQAERHLVTDGRSIIGICGEKLPDFSLCADFRGRHGFLKVNRNKVCSFADGRFSSISYQAKLVQLEELLLETDLDRMNSYFLFKIVVSLVHHSQQRKHGCTVVLDLNPDPVPISGQNLSPPLDLQKPYMLKMAKSLAKVDGALHIGADMHLHGFACLLDGRSFPGEDLARGARYNSALRFTAEHPNIIVVVVSSDRPVSVIHQGLDVHGACTLEQKGGCIYNLERLDYWVGL